MKRVFVVSLGLLGIGAWVFFAAMARVTIHKATLADFGVLPFVGAGVFMLGVIGLVAWGSTLLIASMAPKPPQTKDTE